MKRYGGCAAKDTTLHLTLGRPVRTHKEEVPHRLYLMRLVSVHSYFREIALGSFMHSTGPRVPCCVICQMHPLL